MKILIGLPVFKREWILEEWFRCIERQTIPLSEMGFLFELGPHDEGTHNMLWEWHSHHPEVAVFDGAIRYDEPHMAHQPNSRMWDGPSYTRMVNFRNNLLEQVIIHQPERYMSLDSDILLEDPTTLEQLYEVTKDGGAAAPLCYMKPQTIAFPNVMSWRYKNKIGGPAMRMLEFYPIGETFQADVIMAAVMMHPDVYNNVRYRWHFQGEDLGWAGEAGRQGHKLYSVSGVHAPHIMHDWMLDDYFAAKTS
jgi:hypothetical protein